MNSNTGTKKSKINKKDLKPAVQSSGENLENSAGKSSNTKEKGLKNSAAAERRLHRKTDSATQKNLAEKEDKSNAFAGLNAGKIKQSKHLAANALENSSEHVKNFDFVQTGNKIKKTVSEKPQIGFFLAGVFGLLIGLLVGRRTS